MGFILNRPQPLRFEELVENLDLDGRSQPQGRPARKTGMSECARDFPIQCGGRSMPVAASCCTPMIT